MSDSNKLRDSHEFNRALRTIFSELDDFGTRSLNKPNLTPSELEERVLFGRYIKGQFARISRIKSGLSEDVVAAKFGWTSLEYKQLEAGHVACPEIKFFELCELFGAKKELELLYERIEEAFIPGLASARKEFAESARSHGIEFADPAKYEDSASTVLEFKPKAKPSGSH